MKPVFVHTPAYDIHLPGMAWLHAFDGRRPSRALALATQVLGARLAQHLHRPAAMVSDEDLLRVHTAPYVHSLRRPAVVAQVLETPLLAWAPAGLVARRIVEPMRWAAAGTVLALELALQGEGALALNFGGGFHHACPDHGEGSCLLADAAVALAAARAHGLLQAGEPVAVIDLDAHRGNGFWAACGSDPSVRVLDIYNCQTYPGPLPGPAQDFPYQLPVQAGTGDAHYLALLRQHLGPFLDGGPRPRVVIYNAGNDVIQGDPVGRLALTPAGLRERDLLVLRALAERDIPAAIVPSGGYSTQAARCVSELAQAVATCTSA